MEEEQDFIEIVENFTEEEQKALSNLIVDKEKLLELAESNEPEKPIEVTPTEVVEDDFEEDFKNTKKNLRQLAKVSAEAIEDAMKFAKIVDHPGAYDALSKLLNAAMKINTGLVDVHEKKKKSEESETPGPQNVTNNTLVFQGTMKDVIKQIKDVSE